MVVAWSWRLCNITFESGVVTEEWRATVTVTLYIGKGERTECKNYIHYVLACSAWLDKYIQGYW